MDYRSKTVHEVQHPPRWANIIIKSYSIIVFLGGILGILQLLFVLPRGGGTLIQSTIEFIVLPQSLVPASGLVAILLIGTFFLLLFLHLLYAVALFRLHRFAAVITLVTTLYTFLNTLVYIATTGLTQPVTLAGSLIAIGVTGVVSIVLIIYWQHLIGPARKLWIQVPLLATTGLVTLLVLLGYFFTDDSEINDADLLLLPSAVLSTEENAHYELPDMRSVSELKQADFNEVLTTATEHPELLSWSTSSAEQYLQDSEPYVEAFREAARKSGYQCPTTVNRYGADTPLCDLRGLHDLSSIVAANARAKAFLGNQAVALDTSLLIVRLGYLMSTAEQPMLIEHLVGTALIREGLATIENIATLKTLNSNNVKATQQELTVYMLPNAVHATSLRREYMSMKETAEPFATFSNYFYHHNTTINDIAEIFRLQLQIATMQCGAEYETQAPLIAEQIERAITRSRATHMFAPNSYGEYIKGATMASLNSVKEQECETNAMNREVQKLLQSQLTEADRE